MVSTGHGNTYYLTAAIDYPNGAPHIGHSLEKVAVDVMRRYRLLRGDDAWLTMGLDENSQHIVTAARNNGVDVQAWVDRMEEEFRRAWTSLDIQPDAFVRTTETRHAEASQELFKRAQAAGDIYKSTYAGWYCPNCNAFYTDDDLVAGRCPNHPSIVPDWLEEENYFFALSRYGDRLLAHMEDHPNFIVPALRRSEVLATIRQGLRDFSVSRAVRPGTTPWGIPVPGDESQVLYVWFDALTTYLTGVGFAGEPGFFERMWPAKAHVIGKDITRFHCLYWPAMLLSAGLPLPEHVVVHGFLTVDGQRISKTTGNVIDPVDITSQFGADPVRYYLMRDVSFASDGDFSRATLIRRHNDDLANDLGNLLNRVVSMTGRYREGEVPKPGEPGNLERDLQRVAAKARAGAEDALDAWALDRALDSIWTLVRRSNQYLEERQPWKIAKDESQRATLDTTLASAAESLRLIAVYLAPFIPATADRIMSQLVLPAVSPNDWISAGEWGSRTVERVVPAEPLFPKIEKLEV
jgi:methionyl-tRNA synthetase